MQEPKRTLAYICPKCKQSVAVERTEFQLAAGANKLPCPCGGSMLLIEPEADHMDLTVPCHACGHDHQIRCSTHAFFHEKALAFSCKATGLDCLYVGEEGTVFQALRRLEETVEQAKKTALHDQQQGEEGEASPFLNEAVMTEILGELKDIATRGGISCARCGSKKYELKIHYSSVELTCGECGAKLRIPAATGEDLEDLCCQYTLHIGGKGEA